MMNDRVVACSDHQPVQFAASELQRYRALMDPNAGRSLRVGLFADLLPQRQPPADAAPDHPFDDAVFIDVRAGSGIVAGNNPRSCLLAVYRLLRAAGCRFLRPGPDGEVVPSVDWGTLDVAIDERPTYRHRGLCIEGALSREIFLATIDWLPKNGMNAYFIQFREGFTFFDRWYSHYHNTHRAAEPRSVAAVQAIVTEGLAAIAQRGLVYHAVGHGWTCEPLGIPGRGWEATTEVPAAATPYLAELDGRRELFHGVALNTNLCYGNPAVRDLVVADVVQYAHKHREIDLLHVWLGDGANNQCECALCRDTRPADFYVQVLNQIDTELTTAGLSQRIVFLAYVDLLWPPEHRVIANPDRFVLMFAPITRTYSEAFVLDSPAGTAAATTAGRPGAADRPLPAYQRNRLSFPRSADENLAFLRPWQNAVRPGSTTKPLDAFDFDYHLMWDHYKDPGYEAAAAVLHQDLQHLGDLGLNGLISCQVQRVFFPTPLPMAVLAQTLWDARADLAAIATDTYSAAFGERWVVVRELLQQVSQIVNPPWLRLEQPLVNAEQADRLRTLPAVVAQLRALAAATAGTEFAPAGDPATACRAESWRLVALFCDYLDHFGAWCLALAQGQRAEAETQFAHLVDWVFATEPETVYTFDGYIMVRTLESIMKKLPPA